MTLGCFRRIARLADRRFVFVDRIGERAMRKTVTRLLNTLMLKIRL